jgi:hypothetical protein
VRSASSPRLSCGCIRSRRLAQGHCSFRCLGLVGCCTPGGGGPVRSPIALCPADGCSSCHPSTKCHTICEGGPSWRSRLRIRETWQARRTDRPAARPQSSHRHTITESPTARLLGSLGNCHYRRSEMVTSCVDLGRSSHVLSGGRFASFPRDRIRDVSHTVGGTAGAWGRSKL